MGSNTVVFFPKRFNLGYTLYDKKRKLWFQLFLEFSASFLLVFFIIGITIFNTDTGLGVAGHINNFIWLRATWIFLVVASVFYIFDSLIRNVDISLFGAVSSYANKRYGTVIFILVILTQIAAAIAASFLVYFISDFLLNTWVVADLENGIFGSTMGAQVPAIEGTPFAVDNRNYDIDNLWLLIIIQLILNIFVVYSLIKISRLISNDRNYSYYYSNNEKTQLQFSIFLLFFVSLFLATKFNCNGFSFARIFGPALVVKIFDGANPFPTTIFILIEHVIIACILYYVTSQNSKKSKI